MVKEGRPLFDHPEVPNGGRVETARIDRESFAHGSTSDRCRLSLKQSSVGRREAPRPYAAGGEPSSLLGSFREKRCRAGRRPGSPPEDTKPPRGLSGRICLPPLEPLRP